RSKNKREHHVPLSSLALAQLPSVLGNGYIFSTDGGRTHISTSKPKAALDSELEFKEHWRLHDIRRTVVTMMAEIGIAPHVIEAVVNHVSGHKGGVAGIYNRAIYAEPKRKALERWAEHVEHLITGQKVAKVAVLRKS